MVLGIVSLVSGFVLGIKTQQNGVVSGAPGAVTVVLFVAGLVAILVGAFLPSINVKNSAVRNGPTVVGKLVSIGQTGTYVNQQPQCQLTVQFTTKDGQQVTASDLEVIMLTDLATWQTGRVVPLRYNPSNPQEMEIIKVGVVDATTTDGVTGGGIILAVERNGTFQGKDPVCQVTVQFETGDGQQITASETKAIPLAAMVQCQVGGGAIIRYDPQEPASITIVGVTTAPAARVLAEVANA